MCGRGRVAVGLPRTRSGSVRGHSRWHSPAWSPGRWHSGPSGQHRLSDSGQAGALLQYQGRGPRGSGQGAGRPRPGHPTASRWASCLHGGSRRLGAASARGWRGPGIVISGLGAPRVRAAGYRRAGRQRVHISALLRLPRPRARTPHGESRSWWQPDSAHAPRAPVPAVPAAARRWTLGPPQVRGPRRGPAHTEPWRQCGRVGQGWGPVSQSALHVRADDSRMFPHASPPSRASPTLHAPLDATTRLPRRPQGCAQGVSGHSLGLSFPVRERDRLAQEASSKLRLASPTTSCWVRAPPDLGDGDEHGYAANDQF